MSHLGSFKKLTTFKSHKIMIFSFQRETDDSSVMWQMKQTAESFSNQFQTLFFNPTYGGTGDRMETDHPSPVLQKHTVQHPTLGFCNSSHVLRLFDHPFFHFKFIYLF